MAKFFVEDQLLEGSSELRRPVGGDEQTGYSVSNGLRDSTNVMSYHWKSVSRRLEIDESKPFNTVAMIHTRHRENIGAIVDVGQFIVRQISQEPH